MERGVVQEQVFPVRHATSPHFRRFRANAFKQLVDQSRPRSEAHKKCIAFMLRHLSDRGVKLTTPTFEMGVRSADG